MLLFTLHVKPVPQKQTRFSCKGGFPRAYDPSKKDLEILKWQLKAYAPREPFLTPMIVDYTFYLPIPESTSGVKRRQMINGVIKHIKKPDVDNLSYLVTNAMKGIIYHDDSQIIEKRERKLYGEEPRIVVKILEDETIQLCENKYV